MRIDQRSGHNPRKVPLRRPLVSSKGVLVEVERDFDKGDANHVSR